MTKLTEPQRRLIELVGADPKSWGRCIYDRYQRRTAVTLIAKGLLVEVNPDRNADTSLMVRLPDGRNAARPASTPVPKTQMPEQPPPRSQQVAFRPATDTAWAEIAVRARDSTGDLASITRIASKNDSGFVDVSIEEYTGMTRRAKFTSVRLEEEAARALQALLNAKFSKE